MANLILKNDRIQKFQDKEGNRVEDNKEPPGQMPSSSSASMMSKMAGAKTRIVCPDELSSLVDIKKLKDIFVFPI